MAVEGRMWVISASGLLRPQDMCHLDEEVFPFKKQMMELDHCNQDGGSMIVDPQGQIVAGPLVGQEGIICADADVSLLLRERQNFDYSGHYHRPDVFNPILRNNNNGSMTEHKRSCL